MSPVMPDTYVRFVTAKIDDFSDKRQGVFQAVIALLDTRELADHEREELQAIGKWFDRHLGVPKRFARSSKASNIQTALPQRSLISSRPVIR